jgi:hypothetical protein
MIGMTDDKPDNSTVRLVDNPMAPDFFADTAIGFHLRDGVVKVTLGSVRVNHGAGPHPVNNVVIGRLVMSLPGAHGLAVGLFEFLKSRGVDVSRTGDPKKAN